MLQIYKRFVKSEFTNLQIYKRFVKSKFQVLQIHKRFVKSKNDLLVNYNHKNVMLMEFYKRRVHNE